jgi:hypothetical protein
MRILMLERELERVIIRSMGMGVEMRILELEADMTVRLIQEPE